MKKKKKAQKKEGEKKKKEKTPHAGSLSGTFRAHELVCEMPLDRNPCISPGSTEQLPYFKAAM